MPECIPGRNGAVRPSAQGPYACILHSPEPLKRPVSLYMAGHSLGVAYGKQIDLLAKCVNATQTTPFSKTNAWICFVRVKHETVSYPALAPSRRGMGGRRSSGCAPAWQVCERAAYLVPSLTSSAQDEPVLNREAQMY